MRFEYYRFLLAAVDSKQDDLFQGQKKSREELIKEIFSEGKTYTFEKGKSGYGFVIKRVINKKAFGQIAKQKEAKIVSSPSEGLEERQEETWPCSYVVINLDDEKKNGETDQFGQVIAVQVNTPVISNNASCLRALSDHINTIIINDAYHISINPIQTGEFTFWSVIDKYQGQVTKATLSYTSPNLFNLENKLEDDLRKANQEFNTTNTQLTLESQGGNLNLSKDNELLSQSAEYIDKGGGVYALKLKNGKTITSNRKGVKTEAFDGKEINIEGVTERSLMEIIKNVLKQP